MVDIERHVVNNLSHAQRQRLAPGQGINAANLQWE
jgi:hypothetical protein